MSFAKENGYTPQPVSTTLEKFREGINEQFDNDYDEESFEGTNHYKYSYGLAQKVSEGEVKTAEIFVKLQEYIETTNDEIQRPSVSFPGLVEAFEDDSEHESYRISVKPITEADAGKIFICVDIDEEELTEEEFDEKKAEVCQLLSEYVVAGMVYMGDQTESITLSNGQSFDFSFFLPVRTPIKVRAVIKKSENSLLATPDDIVIRQKIYDNVQAKYRLGWNFEPQKYYNNCDAPWAESISLQWSIDDGYWQTAVHEADYRDLFEIGLENIFVEVTE
jgi:hypothetical protein